MTNNVLTPKQIQITYGLTGHDLNIAIIFSSLQLFNVCANISSCMRY